MTFKKFYKKYMRNIICLCVLLAFVLNLTIESLARQSLLSGFAFFLDRPLVFLFNVLIIFTTLSLALLVRRRVFTYILISALWLALGITNGVILKNRMTPFTTKDLSVLGDGISIVTNYLSTQQIILSICGVVLLLAILVLLFIFLPEKKTRINRKKNAAVFVLICLSMFGATNLAIRANVIETFFGNLAYAYRDNGVPYCFITTWLNTGIRMPSGYSEESVLGIFNPEELGEGVAFSPGAVSQSKDAPNIILLQLESFFDPGRVNGIVTSEDPIPFFRSLTEKYSSGFLTVPSVGAGTANTEFEVLTGMSVKFFGPGEYPYKSVLLKETCESVPFDLKRLGYATHAIHNHRGAFYGRNKVFANIGFDTFTSLEYMNNVAKTPKNWAKDRILTEQIFDALRSTQGRDYIYVISAQGHGKYPMEQVLTSPRITVSAPTEELKWQYEYYVNQLFEMDLFVKDLTEQLSKHKEKVILAIYGDHLPALEMEENDLNSGSVYQTQYVIWSNFKLNKKDKELSTYKLSAELLDRVNIHEGTLVKFHQNRNEEDPSYLPNLRMLEYDMLYGKRYIYGGNNPFQPTNLQMGINPIAIEDVVQIGKQYFVKGQNFTVFSKVSLDGKILKTTYLGTTILALSQPVTQDEISRLKISQVEKNNEILSTTE